MSTAKISFFGAAGEVTGSAYLVETERCKILVDCGLHQGSDSDERDAEPFAFSPADLDAVVLTHAHIDHSGRLPLLIKEGFKGKIWATAPTIDLASVLLRDTVRLMAEEAEWKTRKNTRKGLPAVKPLYNDQNVEDTLQRFEYAHYDDQIKIADGVQARYRDAGHIIGAAMVELWIEGNGGSDKPIKIVFSGDLGPRETVIEKPPTLIEEADYVIIESTYGDRSHKSLQDTREEFREEMRKAILSGGKILVPTFVVDRAQRVLHELLRLQMDPSFPKLPKIYFDSPMGAKATQIYEKYMSLLSRQMQEHARAGQNPFSPDGLSYTANVEQSRAINDIDHAIVLAGSGMCTGGRIVHHLKHNLWNRNCNVFFVGYQANGTLGRRLIDGVKNVRIAGEDVTVNASLHTIGGFSAHGDREDLLSWASVFSKHAVFFVTHGEPRASEALASGIRDMGYEAVAPSSGTSYDLAKKDALSTAASLPQQPSKGVDRDTVLALLQEISSEAETIREDLDNWKDYNGLMPLLESSRLILSSVKNVK